MATGTGQPGWRGHPFTCAVVLLALLLGAPGVAGAIAGSAPAPAMAPGTTPALPAALRPAPAPDLPAAPVLRPAPVWGPTAESHRGARWTWPLAGRPPVVHRFEAPEQRWLAGHRGIDLAGAEGQAVRAVAAGTVTYSGTINGVGIITIRHGPDLRSTYQPVGRRVAEGSTVRAGDQVGVLEGMGDHCPVLACLHLGAIRGRETYLDPLLFLQDWELSLLPLEAG